MTNKEDQIEQEVSALRESRGRSPENSGPEARMDAMEAIAFQLVEIQDQVRRVGSVLQWLIVILIVLVIVFMIFLANTDLPPKK
jgi:hypothetical protein